MQDPWLAGLVAAAQSLLVVFVTSALIAEHTSAHVPRALLREEVRRPGRKALIVELPWIVAILVGGEVVLILFLVHPNSTLVVRIVAAVQLVATAGWLTYLTALVYKSR